MGNDIQYRMEELCANCRLLLDFFQNNMTPFKNAYFISRHGGDKTVRKAFPQTRHRRLRWTQQRRVHANSQPTAESARTTGYRPVRHGLQWRGRFQGVHRRHLSV